MINTNSKLFELSQSVHHDIGQDCENIPESPVHDVLIVQSHALNVLDLTTEEGEHDKLPHEKRNGIFSFLEDETPNPKFKEARSIVDKPKVLITHEKRWPSQRSKKPRKRKTKTIVSLQKDGDGKDVAYDVTLDHNLNEVDKYRKVVHPITGNVERILDWSKEDQPC